MFEITEELPVNNIPSAIVKDELSIIKKEVCYAETGNPSPTLPTETIYEISISGSGVKAEVLSENEDSAGPGSSPQTTAWLKQEMDIGPTELKPPNIYYTRQPCKTDPDCLEPLQSTEDVPRGCELLSPDGGEFTQQRIDGLPVHNATSNQHNEARGSMCQHNTEQVKIVQKPTETDASMEEDAIYDPYERGQKRFRDMMGDVSTDEEPDPYADDNNEYESDSDYRPSEASSTQSDSEESCSEGGGGSMAPAHSVQPHVASTSAEQRCCRRFESIPQETIDHVPVPGENATAPAPIPVVEPTDESAWNTTTAPIPNFNFDDNSAGLKIEINPDTTPLDVLECLLTPDILDYILKCSNAHGEALSAKNRPKTRHSCAASFRPIQLDELKKFFGLCLLQGQISTSNMRRFFSYTDILYYHPIYSFIMSGRRFEQILRALCCSPLNSKNKEKVQGLIDMLTIRYQSVYSPTKQLSLDESLLHFRGRLFLRVYMKNEKGRFGIKFFELTTSDGYLLNMEIYSGTATETEDDSANQSKTAALVLRLMKPYLMKGHELFMDNYYNSYELSEKLLGLRTHTNGTLRSNRKDNPRNLVKKKLKRGEHFWVRRKSVYVSKWKDKRDVLLMTTRNHPRMIKVKNRFGLEKIKPEEVSMYNDHMSGVYRDQMTATYSSPRKTIRWYKKVIFHLLDVTMWNAFFIYRKYLKGNSKRYRFLQFRDEIVKQFLQVPPNIEGKHLVRRNKNDNRPPSSADYSREELHPPGIESVGHWPEKNPGMPGPNSKKKSVFLKCRLCISKKIRKETSFRCKGCITKPPLCPECFEEWHLRQNK